MRPIFFVIITIIFIIMILTKSIKIIDKKKNIINDEKVEDFDNFYHNQDYESKYLVKNLENKKMSNYNLLEK